MFLCPLVSVFLLTGCYLSTQAYAFLSMQCSAKNTEKMLSDSSLDGTTRDFLIMVNGIKKFGEEYAGLKRGKNFTTYVQYDKPYVALVVQAAPEFSLESKLWHYPVVGSLPYRGFYRENDARAEAERLKAQHFDVIIRPVEAFSSLGFFKDPLYSFMLDYDEADMANLILHEETHATVFLKKHAGFNEEFAAFVGDTASFVYLESTYGADTAESVRQKASDEAADTQTFRSDMASLAGLLRPLYASAVAEPEKRVQKEKIIADFQSDFARSYEDRYKTSAYRGFGGRAVNNAYISLYLLYGEHQDRFSHIYAGYGGDLRAFIADVAAAAIKSDDPWAAVARLEKKNPTLAF
jgi:predicted aminopeptidase